MKNQSVETKIKFPLFEVLLGHYDLLLKANYQSWLICFIFAGIETLIFALSGNLATCISDNFRNAYFCTDNAINYAAIRVIIIFIECMFARNWVEVALTKKDFSLKNIFIPSKKDFKLLGVFIGALITLLIAVLSIYLLYKRVPNPDWHIELCYFAFVSMGFLVPLLSLRFNSYVAAAALGQKFQSPRLIWQGTKGSFMKISGSLLLLFMLASYIMLRAEQFSVQAGNISGYGQALIIDYLINLIKLILIALVMNFCYIQNRILSGGNEHE